jgi:hypothetical protein
MRQLLRQLCNADQYTEALQAFTFLNETKPAKVHRNANKLLKDVSYLFGSFIFAYYSLWPLSNSELTSEVVPSSYLVELLGREIGPSQGFLPTQDNSNKEKTQTYIHASCEIRIHDPSARAVEDALGLGQRGSCDKNVKLSLCLTN